MTIEQPADPAEQEWITTVFRTLRKIDATAKPYTNQHDRVVVLIKACITAGIDEGKRIVGALKRLEYDGQFVGILLNKRAGNDPARHDWRRDDDGRYHLLDDLSL